MCYLYINICEILENICLYLKIRYLKDTWKYMFIGNLSERDINSYG